MCDTPVAQSPPLSLLCNTRLAKSLVSGLIVTVGPVCCPTNPRLPFIFTGMQTASSHLPPLLLQLNAHLRMDIRGLKETVKMRWKKVGQTRANLDMKSWNKILRSSGRRSPVWKYLHSMVFVAAGQVDMAPLRVRLLRGRKAGSFHSDAIIHGLTLTGRGRKHSQ